jgi:hypothetical protein
MVHPSPGRLLLLHLLLLIIISRRCQFKIIKSPTQL